MAQGLRPQTLCPEHLKVQLSSGTLLAREEHTA